MQLNSSSEKFLWKSRIPLAGLFRFLPRSEKVKPTVNTWLEELVLTSALLFQEGAMTVVDLSVINMKGVHLLFDLTFG